LSIILGERSMLRK